MHTTVARRYAIVAKHHSRLAQVDTVQECSRHYWHRTRTSRSMNKKKEWKINSWIIIESKLGYELEGI
jgi:hypothetical protein